MKRLLLAAALAALTAAPAAAQHPGPMTSHMSSAQMQQMRQMHQQLRAQLLNDLTPAHKALLAQVAGRLATSTNPDYDAAAARLDAALSPAEKTHILSAASAMRAKVQSMMPKDHPAMGGEHLTPGGILLMLTGGHGPEMQMMHH